MVRYNKFFTTNRGTILLSTVIAFFVISTISVTFLLLTGASYRQNKNLDGKMRSSLEGISGVISTIAKIRVLAKSGEEPTFANGGNLYPGGPPVSIPRTLVNNIPGLNSGTWAHYPEWHKKQFSWGSFCADIFINDQNEVLGVHVIGVCHNVRHSIMAIYSITELALDLPELSPVTVVGSPEIAVEDGYGNSQLPILLNGAVATISGEDHFPNGESKSNTESGYQGTTALENNIEVPFFIETDGGNAEMQIYGGIDPEGVPLPQANINANDKRATIDAIIDAVQNSPDTVIDLAGSGNETLTSQDNIGAAGDYQKVHVKVGNKELRLTGKFQGYGILVADVDSSASFKLDISGGAEWHGLIILKYNNCSGLTTPIQLSGGGPNAAHVIGALLLYFTESQATWASSEYLLRKDGDSSILFSSDTIKNSVAVLPGQGKLYTLKSWRNKL